MTEIERPGIREVWAQVGRELLVHAVLFVAAWHAVYVLLAMGAIGGAECEPLGLWDLYYNFGPWMWRTPGSEMVVVIKYSSLALFGAAAIFRWMTERSGRISRTGRPGIGEVPARVGRELLLHVVLFIAAWHSVYAVLAIGGLGGTDCGPLGLWDLYYDYGPWMWRTPRGESVEMIKYSALALFAAASIARWMIGRSGRISRKGS